MVPPLCTMRIPHHIRAGIIINPKSGANRRRPVSACRLSSCFNIPVREVKNPAEVRSAVYEFSRNHVNVIVVSGGDGTVQALHTALFTSRAYEFLPPLIVVGAGTTNMTAGDVGVSCGLVQVLEKIAGKTAKTSMKLITRDIVKLKIPGTDTYYGMFFTTGAICDAMVFYHTKLHGRGFWGLPGILVTFTRFLISALTGKDGSGHAARRIRLKIDNDPAVTGQFMLFMVTTLERLIFGIRPFYQGQGRGPLHFTAMSDHPAKLWREFPGIISGRPSARAVAENGYWFSDINRIELELEGNVALDGEMYNVTPGSGPVTIECAGACSFITW